MGTDGATTGSGWDTCLIAGCGYVGTRLARFRFAPGAVLALVRSPSAAKALAGDGIPTQILDLERPAAIRVPAGPFAILYTVPPPSSGLEDGRLRNFLKGLGAARPEVLVYLSTTGVYGDTQGRPVDEGSPLAPAEAASRRRVAAEGAALGWCQAHGVRCVVLRVPGIYGPHRLPLERLERGEPVLDPAESGPGNRIHVDDLVAACEAALRKHVAGIFNAGDGEHASIGAFFERVAALAGLPAPHRISLAEARRELDPGLLSYLLASREVLTRRMHAELGVTLRYADLDEGIRASLKEMGR